MKTLREQINEKMRKKVEEDDQGRDLHKLFIDGQIFELYMNKFENLNTN